MIPNTRAFLDTIAWSEIGPELLAKTDNGYGCLVGSTPQHPLVFTDYSQHPRIHNAATNSDAAGRYQFMGRYWQSYKVLLNLPDFGHESQDKWAIQLIKERHATDDVDAGRIEDAITKCSDTWASFPGNGYGQHVQKMDDLIAVYVSAGGTLA